MPMQTAILLTRFSINQVENLTYELFERMKHGKAFDYVIQTNKNTESYLKNKETGAFQEIYKILDPVIGYYYGVCGDSVGGQIDSRTNTDQEIQVALKKILALGNIVPKKRFL